jgi:serine/threonine protein kinase
MDLAMDLANTNTNILDHSGEILGKGAFSVVYKHLLNDVPCAIKYADKNENSRRYMRHEVQILEALRGARHSVQISKYKISKNGYIIYELLESNLYEIRKSLSLDDIKKVSDQLLEAIYEMHSLGVVHCDLKPENIMFSADGTLKIIDFGNALFSDEMIGSDRTIGTLYYRPPEYIIGAPLDYRVDYWAFGCIIMELLIGDVLFSPSRDNYVRVHSNMLGQMILLFGDFADGFIASGKYSDKYFDKKNNNVYLHRYLLGRPTTLYKILRRNGYSRNEASKWASFLMPFFKRA